MGIIKHFYNANQKITATQYYERAYKWYDEQQKATTVRLEELEKEKAKEIELRDKATTKKDKLAHNAEVLKIDNLINPIKQSLKQYDENLKTYAEKLKEAKDQDILDNKPIEPLQGKAKEAALRRKQKNITNIEQYKNQQKQLNKNDSKYKELQTKIDDALKSNKEIDEQLNPTKKRKPPKYFTEDGRYTWNVINDDDKLTNVQKHLLKIGMSFCCCY